MAIVAHITLDVLLKRFTDAEVTRGVQLPDGLTAQFIARIPKKISFRSLCPPELYCILDTPILTKENFEKMTAATSQYANKQLNYGFFKPLLLVPTMCVSSIVKEKEVNDMLARHRSRNAHIYEIPIILSSGKMWLKPRMGLEFGLLGYAEFRQSIIGRLGSLYDLQN